MMEIIHPVSPMRGLEWMASKSLLKCLLEYTIDYIIKTNHSFDHSEHEYNVVSYLLRQIKIDALKSIEEFDREP